MPTQKPDCLTCGACCVAPDNQEAYADVTAEDARRLGRRFVRLHVLGPSALDTFAAAIDGKNAPPMAIETRWTTQRSGPYKGFEVSTCAALRGSIGSRVRCSVYEKRPKVCRTAVKPGDRACREIRKAFSSAKDGL